MKICNARMERAESFLLLIKAFENKRVVKIAEYKFQVWLRFSDNVIPLSRFFIYFPIADILKFKSPSYILDF